MKKKAKPYDQMTTAELRKATAEFDREFIIDTFRPLTPAEKASWLKAVRKPARSQQGKGVQTKGLLARADRTARRLGITRAELISRGLHAALIVVGE